MISKKRNKIALPQRIITRSERMLEQRDSFFTKGSHAVHLLFHLPATAWTFSKTSAVGITSSQTWGRGKEALKQEDNVLVIQWQLAMSGRAPPKSIKNKLTHLSFLRLLGTSTGTAVDFLTTRCTIPNWGQRGGEWIKKVKALGLPGSVACSQQQILRDGIKKGKFEWNGPAPL